ncbi:MAG: hypothetical protein Q7K43_01620 [Candidatus Woesearchaeota archaeon]|nr:hypothetical protein [Candidatus Woesearchaeota archaeon]
MIYTSEDQLLKATRNLKRAQRISGICAIVFSLSTAYAVYQEPPYKRTENGIKIKTGWEAPFALGAVGGAILSGYAGYVLKEIEKTKKSN